MMSAKNTIAAGLKLYVFHECPYCHRAAIAAHERGVTYETVVVPRDTPDWYKKINPSETVPTLEVAEGTYVFESNLIAQYFDDMASPAGALMGSSPYQRHRIEFFMSQVDGLASACNALLWEPHNAEKRKALEEQVAYIEGIISENQQTGGPYVFDEVFTMADVCIVPFLIRFSAALAYFTGFDLFAKGPHMKRMWAAASKRPSVTATSIPVRDYIKGYASHVPDDFFIKGANLGPVLYSSSLCPFADRARLACAAKGFKHFYVEVDFRDIPAWYKYVNPRETVPTLLTADGEYVHESQLIAQYVDSAVEGGTQLVPRGDAEKKYAVNLFVKMADHFVTAFYQFSSNQSNQESKDELVWVIKEIQKLMEKKPFGKGPFYGGAAWNAGDIALMPFVLRLKANTPEFTAGFDAFAEFPFLEEYLKAGQASEIAKGIFKKPEELLTLKKAYLTKLQQQGTK